MKKNAIVAAAALAAIGVATYFVRKKVIASKRQQPDPAGSHPHRHSTGVFARAKAVSQKHRREAGS
ncbi:MAG TPA: hypothetical protein VGC95_01970 [Chitinophagaceae bacterium]